MECLTMNNWNWRLSVEGERSILGFLVETEMLKCGMWPHGVWPLWCCYPISHFVVRVNFSSTCCFSSVWNLTWSPWSQTDHHSQVTILTRIQSKFWTKFLDSQKAQIPKQFNWRGKQFPSYKIKDFQVSNSSWVTPELPKGGFLKWTILWVQRSLSQENAW